MPLAGMEGATIVSLSNVIMLVEDDPAIRELLSVSLTYEGYVVTAFPNGQEALDAARLEPPALTLTDLQMPVLDGRGLIEHLRQEIGASLPIIAMSATSEAADVHDLAIQDYIRKPFDLDDLLARIQSQLPRSAAPRRRVVSARRGCA
jgi:DNA-binding response OmpR family regulator